MRPKLSKKLLKYMLYIALALAAAYGLIWIILQGYRSSAAWTGFADFIKPSADFERGKTLWNWLELLIIPALIGVGLFLLNRSEKQTELDIATDRQREEALQAYLDRMSDLLLAETPLSAENEKAKKVARARTLAVLRGLDGARRGLVVRFLHETGLIKAERIVVDLKGADLQGAELGEVDLVGDELSNTNLKEADLHGASLVNAKFVTSNLEGANLRSVNLTNADLEDANLNRADMRRSRLAHANLRRAKLESANLRNADAIAAVLISAHLAQADLRSAAFKSVNLEKADLTGAYLQGAFLSKALDLEEANLRDAKLDWANLKYSDITKKQLDSVRSHEGATLPKSMK
jgi:uncharacterized protein YjbI with pentapeptide repeats